MGPPWLMKDGASLLTRVSNNEGYARWDKITIEVYTGVSVWLQVCDRGTEPDLLISTLGRNIFRAGETGETVNESVHGCRSHSIIVPDLPFYEPS